MYEKVPFVKSLPMIKGEDKLKFKKELFHNFTNSCYPKEYNVKFNIDKQG